MAFGYEFWSTDSGNLIGSYDTQESALAAVAASIGAWGRDHLTHLALTAVDVRGRSRVVAIGADLSRLAEIAQPDGSVEPPPPGR
jgi:hypothetical protein